MRAFEMAKVLQDIEAALLSAPPAQYWDSETALGRLAARGFRLSPRDHWDNNGILEDLVTWSDESYPASLLWIGGQSGNQDPWITEFSLDLVQALQLQQITVLFIFCSEASATLGNLLTPTLLVKQLIVQAFRAMPRLAYENPTIYNSVRLGNIQAFIEAWDIFEDLLSSMTNVYIIIDRIEDCLVDDDTNLKTDLLPSFGKLVQGTSTVKVIVTSIYEPPAELLSEDLGEIVESVFIDTRAPS